MVELLVKITPNSNFWILPSGNKLDLSGQTQVFEKIYGYGHEEWLFNPRYIVDGYQYGHIRSLERSQKFVNNRADRIYLYSIIRSRKFKQALYHGYINNVESINTDTLSENYPSVADRFFSTITLAKSEVQAIGGNPAPINLETFRPIIRFRPIDVQLLRESISIPDYPFNRDKYYEAHNVIDYPEVNFTELHVTDLEENLYLSSNDLSEPSDDDSLIGQKDDGNILALEGNEILILKNHIVRERNSAIVRAKKNQALRANRLICEVCTYSFKRVFGRDFIECHHLSPLATNGERITSLEDLALVCSNCHRMLHSKFDGRFLSIEELKERFFANNKT